MNIVSTKTHATLPWVGVSTEARVTLSRHPLESMPDANAPSVGPF